jgi:hypothetical protein
VSVSQGPPPTITPKWRRELRLLKRDGPVKYIRLAWKVRRFNRSVKKLP